MAKRYQKGNQNPYIEQTTQWPKDTKRVMFDMRILITLLVSFGHCVVCSIYGFWLPFWYLLAIVLSVRYTDSDYSFGIFWPLCCDNQNPYIEQTTQWPKDTKRVIRIRISNRQHNGQKTFWYLLAIVLSVRYTDSDYPFGIFWPLCCLFDIRILITLLVSFGHCVVCSIYGFWLPYIEQTTQWPKDTKRVIRIRISNRQHNGQKIPKG
jgi:hypothetical protein